MTLRDSMINNRSPGETTVGRFPTQWCESHLTRCNDQCDHKCSEIAEFSTN